MKCYCVVLLTQWPWPLTFETQNITTSRVSHTPSLNTLGSLVFELCCGQTNRQTDWLTRKSYPRRPTESAWVGQHVCAVEKGRPECVKPGFHSNARNARIARNARKRLRCVRCAKNRIDSIVAFSSARTACVSCVTCACVLLFFACVIFLRLCVSCALFILLAYFSLRKALRALRAFEWKPGFTNYALSWVVSNLSFFIARSI